MFRWRADVLSGAGDQTKPRALGLMSRCVALIKGAKQALILNELLH